MGCTFVSQDHVTSTSSSFPRLERPGLAKPGVNGGSGALWNPYWPRNSSWPPLADRLPGFLERWVHCQCPGICQHIQSGNIDSCPGASVEAIWISNHSVLPNTLSVPANIRLAISTAGAVPHSLEFSTLDNAQPGSLFSLYALVHATRKCSPRACMATHLHTLDFLSGIQHIPQRANEPSLTHLRRRISPRGTQGEAFSGWIMARRFPSQASNFAADHTCPDRTTPAEKLDWSDHDRHDSHAHIFCHGWSGRNDRYARCLAQ